jgi:hypothetical protein
MREKYESNSVFSMHWKPCAGGHSGKSASGNGEGETSSEREAAAAISHGSGGKAGDGSPAGISDASYSSRAA